MTMMIGHSSVSPALRRMLLVGIGMAVAQQAVGIDAIQYYLLDVIGKGDWESETTESLILIGLGLLKLLFIMIGGGLLDRRGRRPMLFGSVMGMAVALFMIGIAFSINSTWSKRTVVLFGLAVYLSSFSIGMGPSAWLIHKLGDLWQSHYGHSDEFHLSFYSGNGGLVGILFPTLYHLSRYSHVHVLLFAQNQGQNIGRNDSLLCPMDRRYDTFGSRSARSSSSLPLYQQQ
jgi:MFS family permease